MCALLAAAACLSLRPGSGLAQDAAGPKDAQAVKVIEDAMGADYLETRFDKAEQKLRAAIEACGDSGCSKKVKAKLYVALGTVLAHGKKQLEDARDAFAEAIGLDPKVELDPNFVSSEITFAFQQARDAFGMAAVRTGVDVKPPPEQQVRTPVPVYAEVREDLLERTQQVTLFYQPAGGGEFKSLVMKKLRGRAWGINIPCADLGVEGTTKYYVLATDKDGAIVASAGTRESPMTTAIKRSISSAPPSWPGFAPPQPCADEGQAKAKPSQCLDDRQCNAGLTCVAGACVQKPVEPPEKDIRRNWFSLSFGPDLSLFSDEDVCSAAGQADKNYVCLREDDSRYNGVPTAGVANNVNPGFAMGTMRLAVGYERMLLDNLSVGGRVGIAFNGTSDGGASFMPVHVEARGQYYLLPKALETAGVKPFVMLSAGVAQVDSHVKVQVFEDATDCGADPTNPDSPCTIAYQGRDTPEPRQQTLSATKQAGLAFATAGIGAKYEPVPGLALNLAVRAGLTFPVVKMLVSPEVGLAIGF